MTIITASKKIKRAENLVTISRQEYEEFLVFKKYFPVVEASAEELRAIRQGKKEIEAGKYTPWEEVKHELANFYNRPRKKANGKDTKV